MFSLLPYDIQYNILSKYFLIIDIIYLNIRSINKNIYSQCHKIIDIQIHNYLQKYNIDNTFFNSNCVLSGSSVLQILTNKNYNTDMDIYIKHYDPKDYDYSDYYSDSDSNNESNEYYKNPEWDNMYNRLIENGYLDDTSKKQKKSRNEYEGAQHTSMSRFMQLTNKNKKIIQLIQVNNINDIIMYEFDMNILKNKYDGKKITIYDSKNIYKRYIDGIRSHKMGRYVKYIMRGFEITNIEFENVLQIHCNYFQDKEYLPTLVMNENIIQLMLYTLYVITNNIVSLKNYFQQHLKEIEDMHDINKCQYEWDTEFIPYIDFIMKYLNIHYNNDNIRESPYYEEIKKYMSKLQNYADTNKYARCIE
jgi:hypothetical protein